MRYGSSILAAGAAALTAVAASAPLRAQDAATQRGAAAESNAGGQAGRAAERPEDRGVNLLVAHGLAMAIDGSSLRALAQSSAATGRSDAVGGGADGAASRPGASGVEGSGATRAGLGRSTDIQRRAVRQLHEQARRAFQGSETLLGNALQSGGNNSLRFYTAANRYASTLRALSGVGTNQEMAVTDAGRGTIGTTSNSGAAGSTPSSPGSRAGAAGVDSGLRGEAGASGSRPADAATSTTSGSGAARPGAGPMDWRGMDVDPAAVAAINHAVKDALESMMIRQAVRATASGDATVTRTLLSHARDMDADSRQALGRFIVGGGAGVAGTRASGTGGSTTASTGSGTGTSRGSSADAGSYGLSDRTADRSTSPNASGTTGSATRQGATIEILAQQAQELVAAIHEIGGDDNGAGAGGGTRSGTGADSSGGSREASGAAGSGIRAGAASGRDE